MNRSYNWYVRYSDGAIKGLTFNWLASQKDARKRFREMFHLNRVPKGFKFSISYEELEKHDKEETGN